MSGENRPYKPEDLLEQDGPNAGAVKDDQDVAESIAYREKRAREFEEEASYPGETEEEKRARVEREGKTEADLELRRIAGLNYSLDSDNIVDVGDDNDLTEEEKILAGDPVFKKRTQKHGNKVLGKHKELVSKRENVDKEKGEK